MLIYLPELLAALQAYVDANADDAREPVSYFGKHEGKGEAFLIGVFGVIAEELLVRFPRNGSFTVHPPTHATPAK